MADQDEQKARLEPKSLDDDLRSLRAKIVAILEAQVVVPLRNELAARQERLRGRVELLEPDAKDAAIVRQGLEAEARKVRSALSLLDDGLVRARSIGLSDMQAFSGRRSAAD